MKRFGIRAAAAALSFVLALGWAGPAQAAQAPGRLEFEVLRNGSPFGRHVVEVSGAGGRLSVSNRVSLSVRAGPVSLFRYEQNCAEVWSARRIETLRCSTLRNGQRTQVAASRTEEGLRVETAEGAELLPADMAPTSWWSRDVLLAARFLDTQTGRPIPLNVRALGRSAIEVGGQQIEADHYRVSGSETVDLWYDRNGRWVACTFTVRGQRITYRLASPLAQAPA